VSRRTARLVIDRLLTDDIPALLEYRNDPEVAEDQGWDLPYRTGAAERLVEDSVSEPIDDGQLAIRLHDGRLIGDLMATASIESGHQFELGISLRRECWGQGYGTEAVTAVVDALFESDRVHRVVAYVATANERSRRLFSGLGFRAEGHLSSSYRRGDGRFVDEVLYGYTRALWRRAGTAAEADPHPADVARLAELVHAYNEEATGCRDGLDFAVFRRDERGRLEAGISGYTWAGIGHIDLLWAREDLRGKGVGRELMAEAEAEMVRRGCKAVHVESHTFQAPGFYERLGYERVFSRVDVPPGHAEVLLRKALG
jgi:RimJ/RimL family protein N-acetyltransferase/N-acetylglutamate synthase-like GNAT family acetyltransferase